MGPHDAGRAIQRLPTNGSSGSPPARTWSSGPETGSPAVTSITLDAATQSLIEGIGSTQSSGASILALIPAWSARRANRLLPSSSSSGLFEADSKDALPYPLVVIRMPLEAPSFMVVPQRSRTALTPTVFL